GGLKRALLVMHSPVDQTVGIENAADIFSAAKHPKSFVTLDDADHLITNKKDAEYAAEVIAAWAARYLSIKQPAAPIGAPEGIVRSTEADAKGFLQDVTAGPLHHVLADEPITYGGTDKGMTPYQFLSAGLASCTSMTIRMYARRKNWPLENTFVDVTHDKVHAQDCDTCETTEGKVDQFNRTIHLSGNLTAEQRQRLLEIADKCPVHRTCVDAPGNASDFLVWFWQCDRVLTCVRPLIAALTRRGPVWRYEDQVHFAHARFVRLVRFLVFPFPSH
ncbi:MAG: OsmC family protein, partial [Shimia sp.]|nr:OsmC family protein [Shimia sp.]